MVEGITLPLFTNGVRQQGLNNLSDTDTRCLAQKMVGSSNKLYLMGLVTVVRFGTQLLVGGTWWLL